MFRRLLLSFLLYSGLASAQVQENVRFSEGVNAYLYGDYPNTIAQLQPLIEPDVLLEPDDAAKAYEYLGLSFYFLEDKEHAKEYFSRLIRLRPDWELDPVLVPPTAITFYNDIHRKMEAELSRQREALELLKRREAERRMRANTREIIIEDRKNSLFVACMPFGLGQFQNDQPILGTLFLSSEIIAIGLSMGFFMSVESMRLSNGFYEHEKYERAQQLQTAQLISGGVAVGLMIGGVIQALYAYRETKVFQRKVTEPKYDSPSLLLWEF